MVFDVVPWNTDNPLSEEKPVIPNTPLTPTQLNHRSYEDGAPLLQSISPDVKLGGAPQPVFELWIKPNFGESYFMEVPVGGTVGDILRQVPQRVSGIPHIQFAGVDLKDLSAPLSDVGIGPESVVNVLYQKPDIELLWELFDDEEYTTAVLGYVTFDGFQAEHSLKEGQRLYFKTKCKLRVLFHEDPSGKTSSVNYDAVGQLTHLIELDLDHSKITGSITFAKLPQGLSVLRMANNQMSGQLNLEGAPPGLIELRLGRNRFDGRLDFGPLAVCKHLDYLDLSGNQFTAVTNQEKVSQSRFIFF